MQKRIHVHQDGKPFRRYLSSRVSLNYIARVMLSCLFVFATSGCASFMMDGNTDGGDNMAPFEEFPREWSANDRRSPVNNNSPYERRRSRGLASSQAPDDDDSFLSYEASRPEYQTKIKHAMSLKNVVLGMTMNQVIRSWGQPSDMQVAGDNHEGNHRWVYSLGPPGQYGSPVTKNRILYFESGRLVGWETE